MQVIHNMRRWHTSDTQCQLVITFMDVGMKGLPNTTEETASAMQKTGKNIVMQYIT